MLAGSLAQVVLQFLTELLELGLAGGELGQPGLGVGGHEVQVVAGPGVQGGLDGGVTGVVDRARRQAGVLVRVVRRGALQLGVGGDDAVRVQPEHDRAVQLHALAEPVVDDPGDLLVVRGAAALGLDQAGHDHDLARAQFHRGRLLGQVVAGGLLVIPVHHALEHVAGGLVGLHLVGGREQVTLDLAARVGGQPERARLLERGLIVGQRDAGVRAELSHDLRDSQAFRDGDLVLDPGGLVYQQRVGQAGLHLPLHPVGARFQAVVAGAVLGGQLEGPQAGHHAQLDQALAHGGRGLPGLHLHHGLAGAGAGVVGRVVAALDELVGVPAARSQREQQDDQDDHQRDQPAPAALTAAGAATAAARRAAAPATAAGLVIVVVVVVVLVAGATQPGYEPVVFLVTVLVVPGRGGSGFGYWLLGLLVAVTTTGSAGRGLSRAGGGVAGAGHVLGVVVGLGEVVIASGSGGSGRGFGPAAAAVAVALGAGVAAVGVTIPVGVGIGVLGVAVLVGVGVAAAP